MISSLLKLVMRDCDVSQRDLAEVLGSPLDRVKGLTSGRVKNLTRRECEALVAKLNIRADWLVTGTGPMLQGEENQDAFAARMHATNRNIELVKALPLAKVDQDRLAALLSGDPVQDAALIAASLQYQLHGGRQHRVESADTPAYLPPPVPVPSLTPRHRALLADFEAASDHDKVVIERVAALAAAGKSLKGAA